ncbi:hypothetical protein PBN151_3156 [Paenibacillus sp. NAIST15-1]|nr:hypothetical protein PBN151_3156 [Paenibacillus sp. NAIST15-1]
MSLQDDEHWLQIARQQNMPNMVGKTYRTAIVYGSSLNIWMVVTDSPCTAESFRMAIKQKIGSGTLTDGIFLDGSGSSQLKHQSATLKGDGRTVYSIVSMC